ncbi:MAG: hypothetical protein EAX96_20675, partial [Candidatus Lokiarchaeota archaeon]|nr:hypothetical protein [Candidatus Lokiarchaeota archaeon]
MELPDYIKNRYWKDFLPPGISLELDIPEDKCLRDLFEEGAKLYGNQIAINFYLKKEYTFQELNDLTYRFAHGLLNLGVKKGDVIAIWLPNSPQFSIAYFAALSIGAIVTALSPLFVAREAVHQINDSGAKILIMIDRFFRQYKKMREEIKIEILILSNIEGDVPKQAEEDEIIHWNSLMDQNPVPKPLPEVQIDPKKDIAIIQYTGGTTGLPKGALLTHYNIVANIYQIKEIADYMKNEYIKGPLIALSVLPWYHIYGQTCEMALSPITGAKAFVFPTFDAEMVLKTLKEFKPNSMLGVTTM